MKALPESYRCLVLSIDAWGNQDEGYEWNNWHKVGEIDFIPAHEGTEAITALIDLGLLNRKALAGCEVEDDGLSLVIVDASTREPLYAIEYATQENGY